MCRRARMSHMHASVTRGRAEPKSQERLYLFLVQISAWERLQVQTCALGRAKCPI